MAGDNWEKEYQDIFTAWHKVPCSLNHVGGGLYRIDSEAVKNPLGRYRKNDLVSMSETLQKRIKERDGE